MSARSPIQVPEELKVNIEGYKDEFHAKTSYEVIEKLVRSHETGKEYRAAVRQEKIDEAARKEREYIHAGADIKTLFDQFRKEMKLTDAQALEMLLCHFNEQPNIGQVTFGLYRSFK